MKKFASVFLTVVILIISLFSVNAFASEQTRTEKWIEKNKIQSPEYEIISHVEIDNSKSVAHAYVKEDKISIIADMPLSETKSFKMKVIVSEGYIYMLLPAIPFFYLKYEATEDMLPSLYTDPLENAVLTDSSEKIHGETVVYIEEYIDNEGLTTKYYFVGDELFKTETSGVDENGASVYSSFEILSKEVDGSVFEIPWYSIDLTPLFIFLSESGFLV